MKTAVEWFANRISHGGLVSKKQFNELLAQAKAMEKEQIIRTHLISRCYDNENSVAEAEQYYNETFKTENIVMFMTPENGEIGSIILTDNPDCGVKGITFKSE